jgi:hypothetical protein
LSYFTTCTHDKYNHSRLYGQSLNLNSYGPNPKVMKAREHHEIAETGLVGKVYPSAQSSNLFEQSMSTGMDESGVV